LAVREVGPAAAHRKNECGEQDEHEAKELEFGHGRYSTTPVQARKRVGRGRHWRPRRIAIIAS
jgi:hypothetical protein